MALRQSLSLGFLGTAAVIAFSVLLTKAGLGKAVEYCGENSIVIYLAFTIPMAASRILLVKTGFVSDPGIIALLVSLAGVCGALTMY